MSIFAVIKNKRIENIIEAESKDILDLVLPDSEIIEQTDETGIAYIGLEVKNSKFIPFQPYNSWIFDEAAWSWNAPTSYPDDGKTYIWSEEIDSWQEIVLPE